MRTDRPLDDAHRQALTRHYAGSRREVKRAPAAVLVFRIGIEWLSLPATSIKEVAEPRAILSLPHRRAGGAVGLVNLHGDLIVHISLARVLGIEPDGGAPEAGASRSPRRLLVFGDATRRLAFDVDEVSKLHRYHPSELRPVPSTLARARIDCVAGILPFEDRTIGCLDAERTLEALSAPLA